MELHAERRGVRPEQRHRLHVVVAALAPTELGVGEIALMAIRIAEVILARFADPVQFVVGHVLAEPVALVVGKPPLAGLRMEVEANVLRTPIATVSPPLPSRFRRMIFACVSGGSQMLHGAPVGT